MKTVTVISVIKTKATVAKKTLVNTMSKVEVVNDCRSTNVRNS